MADSELKHWIPEGIFVSLIDIVRKRRRGRSSASGRRIGLRAKARLLEEAIIEVELL